MNRSTWLAVCLSAAAWADPVYTWTDPDGQDHYTNDPSAVPAGQKAHITRGEELGMIHVKDKSAPPPDKTEKVDAPPAPSQEDEDARQRAEEEKWRFRFRQARQRVARLEARVALSEKDAEAQKYTEVSTRTQHGVYTVDQPAKRTQEQLSADKAQLQRAQDDLNALEREASAEAVPRAWRE